MNRIACLAILLVAALRAAPLPAQAPADAPRPEMKAASCSGPVAREERPRPAPAALRLAALGDDQVRLTFVGHATFLIESPQLVRIATDYNDFVRPPVVPDIATMNHAHLTHYTDHPDPAIRSVLRGWRDDGGPANWDVTYKDVRVRSVSTNIRDWSGGTIPNGNSIFIFEIGSLCIAHLGHLHHTLTQRQLDDMGHVDVVLMPVDGAFTLDLEGMVEVLESIKAPLMIPMHYFSRSTLDRFLARVRDKYPVEFHDTPSVVLSRDTLPASPKFLVLPGH